MAELVSDCMIEVQRIIDCTDAIALEYINKADRDISTILRLRETTEDINLTAGTNEYALSTETILKVWAGRYIRSSATGDSNRMKETSYERMDLMMGDWRSDPSDEPTKFAIKPGSTGGASVLFHPTPATTTSGGYPIVRLYVTISKALISGDSLPALLKSSDVYTYRAAFRLANDVAKDQAPGLYELYKMALQEEIALANARNAYDEPGLVFKFATGGVV